MGNVGMSSVPRPVQPTIQHVAGERAAAEDDSAVTFFTICSAAYLPGLIGLGNSLRLLGHRSPIVVADCDLTPNQREILRPHCTLFTVPGHEIKNPTQYKPFAHLLNPTGTVVIIDSDMIVTKSLATILATAARGKICVFPDLEEGRWFAEWQGIFDVKPPRRSQTYACAGFVAFSTHHWPQLLERWWKACARISTHATYQEHAADGPTSQGDQDALNALLMSEFPADALSFLPVEDQVFRWQFPAVQLRDATRLSCSHQGHSPTILHACLTPKPWQRGGVRRNAYVSLLRHLLTAPDVELQVPPHFFGIWLRRGMLAELSCSALSLMNVTNPDDGSLPKGVVRLARGLKRRLIGLRRSIAA
jgi:hypothetical protein